MDTSPSLLIGCIVWDDKEICEFEYIVLPGIVDSREVCRSRVIRGS